MESQGESLLFGLDAATGRERWKVERPLENNYTTPLIVSSQGRIELIVQADGRLAGYDPATGKKRWDSASRACRLSLRRSRPMGSCSGLAAIWWPCGRTSTARRRLSGDRRDLVRLLRHRYEPAIASTSSRTAAFSRGATCSPERSLVRSGSEAVTWRPPVLAAGKLYLLNEDGDTSVIRTGETPELISTNRLADAMLATPAIGGDCLFLRSDKWLYCVGRTELAK